MSKPYVVKRSITRKTANPSQLCRLVIVVSLVLPLAGEAGRNLHKSEFGSIPFRYFFRVFLKMVCKVLKYKRSIVAGIIEVCFFV